MKHKIIIIALVIATITVVLCVSANAIEYPQTLELNTGDTITLAEEITSNTGITVNLSFKLYDTTISNEVYTTIKQANQNYKTYCQYSNGSNTINAYDYNNNRWENTGYKKIVVYSDTTITNTSVISWLYDNAIEAPWIETPSPHAQELSEMLDDSKSFLSTSLSAATLIITWLAANQICLCAMYLFILVAMVGVCKRFVKGS